MRSMKKRRWLQLTPEEADEIAGKSRKMRLVQTTPEEQVRISYIAEHVLAMMRAAN